MTVRRRIHIQQAPEVTFGSTEPPIIISGDLNILFLDSINISEALAGTLGPVQTQDSVDISEALDAGPWRVGDTILTLDDFGDITGLVYDDTVDISEALSGLLGPIRAPDTFDITDDPDIGPAVVQESVDVSDFHVLDQLSLQAEDTVDFSDALGDLVQVDDDSLTMQDAWGPADSVFPDSVQMEDQFHLIEQLTAGDSVDLSDQKATAEVETQHFNSFAIADSFGLAELFDVLDTLAFGDALNDIDVTNALLRPNATVSNTGWTNPGNIFVDAGAATCAATSSGTLGTGTTQNTTNCDLISSMPNVNWDILQIDAAILEWAISAAQSGTPASAGQCNINYQYSINDGGSWTTFFAQTALNGSTSTLDLSSIVTTLTHVNQFRVRGVGAVLSGTGVLPVTTTASWTYARLRLTLSGPV